MEYQISWFFGVLLLLFSTLCPGSHGLVVPLQGENVVKVAELETPLLGKEEQVSQPLTLAEIVPEVKSVSHPVPEPDSLAVESHVSQPIPGKVEHQVLDIPVVLEVKKRNEEEKQMEEKEREKPNDENIVKPEEELVEGVAVGEEGFEPVVIILTLEPGQVDVYRTAEGNLVKVVDSAKNPIPRESEVPREKCFSYFFPSSPNNQEVNPESPVREAVNPNPNIDSSVQQLHSQYQIQNPVPIENAPPPLLPGQPLSASTVYFPRETFGMRKSQSQSQQTPFIFVPARNNINRPFLLKSHLGSPTLGHQAPVGTEFYSNPNINSFVPVDSNPNGKSDTPTQQEKKENVAPAPAPAEKSESLDKSKSNQPQLQAPVRRLEGRSGMRKRIMARTGGNKRTANSNNMGRWFWNSYYDQPPYEYDYDVYDVYDYDYYSPYQYQQYQYQQPYY